MKKGELDDPEERMRDVSETGTGEMATMRFS